MNKQTVNCCTRFYSLQLNSQMFCVARRSTLIHGLCSPHIGIWVWSPYQMRQIKQIEFVQRSFTRRLLYYTRIDDKTRLLRLGVDSLDLIYTYKIVFVLVTNAGNEFFTLANSVNANINTRGHMYKLFPHQSRIDAHKYVFTKRVVRVWNGLPAEQKHFSSLIQFNTSLTVSIYLFKYL